MNRTLFLSALLAGILALPGRAQIIITAPSTPYTEQFTALGTSATATLPAAWRVDKNATAVRTVGTWAAATNSTNYRAGDNMSSTAANGIYNYGAGDPATATDRALGFIASSSGTKSGNIYAYFRNETGTPITSLTISYTVEKYRGGTNSAGFAFGLSYSTDGSTWVSAGSAFLTVFTPDASNSGYSPAPGQTVPVSGALVVTIPDSGDFYLAWNYSVASGTTTSNAQGLGIDDVSVTATTSSGPLPTSVQFATATASALENAGTVGVTVTITNPSPTTPTTVDVVLAGGTATNGVDIIPPFTTQTLTFPAGSAAPRTAYFTIFDDTLFEGSETLIFQLTNPAGGTSATIGAVGLHTFTILENDSPPIPGIVVNEYFNANGDISTYEAVELIVLKDSLDLRGYQLVDATSGGTYPYGLLTFSQDPLWSSLQSGTIIVVAGLFAGPTEDTDPSDGLLIVHPPPADTSNRFFVSSRNIPSIAATSDAVAVLDAVGSFVHGLAHGSANQSTLPAGRHGHLSSSISSGQSVFFTRGAGTMSVMDFLANTYTATGSPTLAAANDTAGNRGFLRSARSRYITANRALAGTFFWDVTVASGTVTLAGPVGVSNCLTIAGGTLDENRKGISLEGNGNALNGTGAGMLIVGDDVAPAATFILRSDLIALSGAADFRHADGTVRYEGTASQSIIPAAHYDLFCSGGGPAAPKTLSSDILVEGTLNIAAGTWLRVVEPAVITLGPTGTYASSGRFLGSIRTTRNVGTLGVPEFFGGIGLELVPTALPVPGPTTVTMTSGTYVWVDTLPSILRRYTVSSSTCSSPCTLRMRYETGDLNGQAQGALRAQWWNPSAGLWSSPACILDTNARTITLSTSSICGIWTTHASPPRGVISVFPASLSFEAEWNHTLPPARTVVVSNAKGEGSLIEWAAVASTTLTPTWLTLVPSPVAGVNTGSFDAAVTRTDPVPGLYTGSVTIADPHAANHPLTIPVTYTIVPPRRLCVGEDTIFVKATPKRGDVKKDVFILNCGGSFGADVIRWSVSTSTPWLSVSPSSGVEGEAFTLTAACGLMPAQTLVGAITIIGTHSIRGTPISNSPLTIPVVLEVEPHGEAIARTGPMTAGGTRLLVNGMNQRIAVVTLRSGVLTDLTVRVLPDELPPGISRLRYALRTYYFEPLGGPYNLELELFYTGNELTPFMADPAELRGWRQYPVGGVWHACTGYATPIRNSVTITNVTDLAGAWTMAGTFVPLPMPLFSVRATRTGESTAELEWSFDLPITRRSLVVERRIGDTDRWATIAIDGVSRTGTFLWKDSSLDKRAYEYRLLAFEENGDVYESPSVRIDPWTTTNVIERAASRVSLSASCFPNPLMIGARANLRFTLEQESYVTVLIYDGNGRFLEKLFEGNGMVGDFSIGCRTERLSPGVYFVRVSAGNMTAILPLTVIR
ncbi:MAG: Calx-beta domain-containing protein [Bacteroidota bacterium]|nr:Calx-beta domain-containing protein [Bacteroidota bacterium]